MLDKKKFDLLLIAAFGMIFLVCLVILVVPLIQEATLSKINSFQEYLFRGVAWFTFDQSNALKLWEEKIFKGKVLYSIKKDRSGGYLNAYSENAASAILYWLKFEPVKKPMVSWKWKVTKFPKKTGGEYGESSWIEKEDYAARFYVIFPKFPFFRMKSLEYIWDKNLPVGSILTNPNFKNLKIIVIESGEKNLGRWVSVERNVFEDFKKAFGRNPGNVGAIAIMTDAENTASTAEAQYDEIKVGYDK